MLTSIGDFRPGNETIWVIFDDESEISGPRRYVLSLEGFFEGKTCPIKAYMFQLVLVSFVFV